MINIRKSIRRAIEDVIRDYPEMDEYINNRRQELMYPVTESDENVGGGRSNKTTNPTESTVMTINDDRGLQILEKERQVVKECYEQASDDTKTIVDELYFKKHPTYTLNGLITTGKIYVGYTKARELRNSFIKEVGKGIGLIHY